jgi:hypothetical protein
VTTEEATAATTFEQLSNELIYELFEFLYFHHAFQGFYDLNKRFQNLFVHSNLPIKINISSISKPTFHRYLEDIIIPYTSRIQSLRLSSPFAVDMGLLLSPLMTKLIRLETLIINDIKAVHLVKLVNQLFFLPVLSSLFIKSIGSIRDQNDIYQKIFRLTALKYCKLFIETEQPLEPLSITTNEFSSIKHLVINSKVSINELDSLLSYVPQLRRLSFDYFDGYISSRICTNAIQLNYLTDVSLKSHSMSFNDFELLVIDLFRQVQILRIEIYSVYFSATNMGYLNANRWEQLISTHMINLRIFDLQLECALYNEHTDRQACDTEVNKFNSLFWIQHQWFFQHQFYINRDHHTILFYSTNPYR